jgi:hypothetical protein
LTAESDVYVLTHLDWCNVGRPDHSGYDRTRRVCVAVIPADEVAELLAHFRR